MLNQTTINRYSIIPHPEFNPPKIIAPFTLAHELGRMILNKSGNECPTENGISKTDNVMCGTTSDENTILATKRLTREQQQTARQNLSGDFLK